MHRYLQRHSISRLPDDERGNASKRKCKSISSATPISISPKFAPMRGGSISSWRSTGLQIAFTELHEPATSAVSREFLLHLITTVPYKSHTVLSFSAA